MTSILSDMIFVMAKCKRAACLVRHTAPYEVQGNSPPISIFIEMGDVGNESLEVMVVGRTKGRSPPLLSLNIC